MNREKTYKYTNRLIHSGSPYLLQHAHNPVDWYEWGDEAFEKARREDKLILVSIGYSACHWCHVMEHESFQNEETAGIMNELLVCVKVDREERPDVDQIYMDAVQLITGQGGWPLNAFILPDGRPLHGGTYFPNKDWVQVILQIVSFYKNKRKEAEEFADKLTLGVRSLESIALSQDVDKISKEDMEEIYLKWKENFDMEDGGYARNQNKFPMPNNYEFLLRYHFFSKDESALEFADLTLAKMARGGIYDQLGGGFSRYSVDKQWFAPHFEKMLYDNGQLVSLYSEAFHYTGNPLYRDVVVQTLDFVERELTDVDGGFYSALDADSEGVEGKFYVWTKKELEALLGEDAELVSAYYNATESGNWEHGYNILHVKEDDEEFARSRGITLGALREKLEEARRILMDARAERIRPGLDDKIIAGWNGLMLKGYCDAYRVFGTEAYLDAALKNASYIRDNLYHDGVLYRLKKGNTEITGFLEDYASVADAFISLYQVTFDESYLHFAKKLTERCVEDFRNEESGLFFFTSASDAPLVARKTDLTDDVIPSSNAMLAHVFYKLGYYFDYLSYLETADLMLSRMKGQMEKFPAWYSHWANLALFKIMGFYQLAVVGEDALEMAEELMKDYLPNSIFAAVVDETSSLPLLQNRFQAWKTLVYVCRNQACLKPVETVEEARRSLGLCQ